MTDGPMVRLDDLSHRYGALVALDHVSFEVQPASLLALLGPNGSGKTTLFRILTTLLTPTSGSAWVAGADVIRDRNSALRHMGVVFQSPSLDKKLTVLENLVHQGMMHGLHGAELRRRSMERLEQFQIADRAGERVETLSGGLQRRVELAKGLLHDPQVLLLDEPSTGLDPAARAVLMRHLEDLRARGITCLFTTHLMEEAEPCDQVAILDRGRLVALDSPENLRKSIGGDVLTVTARNPLRLAEGLNQEFSVAARVAGGAVRIKREKAHELIPGIVQRFSEEIESVVLGRPTLHDVFFHLTGRTFN
jgi:ABC-2 type transport system ATP-binding protein